MALPPQALPAPSDDLVDEVLPCGLRLVIARDRSLPVAAIVLAVETGSEDDPADLPGLTHALAYQVLQGNRELPPHGAAARVHDAGGWAAMAFGPAQVRYEALVPLSTLDEALWIEAQRLRAITVDSVTWPAALRTARRDRPRPRRIPPQVVAAAHGIPQAGHEGRQVPPALSKLALPRVGQELARRFTYARATLTLVTPKLPVDVAALARRAFADLPEQARDVPARAPAPPLPAHGPPGAGTLLVAAVPPGAVAQELARILCRGINRQPALPRARPPARLRCHLEEDPRRATLAVRVRGPGSAQARARLMARIEALLGGRDRALLRRQRRAVSNALRLDAARPLPAARLLATRAPQAAATTDRSEAMGLTPLASDGAVRAALAHYALPARWSRVIPAPRPRGRPPGGRSGAGKPASSGRASRPLPSRRERAP